ncbi:hypothetical protein [Nonomuraea rubra]|uniref:Uncharacterized protein n=1 Tax=Nonomuraea rubra TaxID=46180 RepID=A0A7X0P6J3_9ACTN|nr:hypothetical protein [Nonomuraea rubra]MBB6556233.1 hypothetical protein [Nonomuraea rubra]
MSTNTPETTNPYKARAQAVDRAHKAFHEQVVPSEPAPGGGRYVPSTLEDCLNDEGVILLPRSTGHGKWRVLVDGQPAPYPGQTGPSHPMGAEEAAEAFLTATSGDYYGQRQIVIRPASDAEMVASAVIGDTTVREEPTKIVASAFLVETDADTGAALLRVFDKDGAEVRVGLDDHMRESLRWILRSDDDQDGGDE